MIKKLLLMLVVISGLSLAQTAVPNIYWDNFEFNDMRSFVVAPSSQGNLCLIPSELSNNPGGQCSNGGSSIWTAIATIKDPSLSIIGPDVNCRGSYCGRKSFTAGTSYDAQDSQFWIMDGQGSTMQSQANAYYRYYMKYDANFRLTPGSDNTSCLGKVLYLRDDRTQTVYLTITSGTQGSVLPYVVNYDGNVEGPRACNLGSCAIPMDGQWHWIEAHLNSPTRLFEVWQDGTLVFQQTLTNLGTNVKPDAIGFGMYLNGSGHGNCRATNNQNLWIDDLAMSTSRIGPTVGGGGGGGGGGGTPTIVPTTYFGMHTLDPTNHWPTVSVGAMRPANVSWGAIETSRGVYNWTTLDTWVNAAQSRGIELNYLFLNTPSWAGPASTLPPTLMQDWTDFVTALVTRYTGRINSYELWNEPNSTSYWTGTIPQLVTMAQQAYTIIKSIDPVAKVLTPSPTWTTTTAWAWMDSYLTAGGGSYADVIAYHGYTGSVDGSSTTIIDNMSTVLTAHGVTKPSWMTEGGWGTNSTVSDASAQAAFLAQRYLLGWLRGSNPITRFYWYQWDNATYGTLWDATNGIHLAGTAYQEVYNWMAGAAATPCVKDASSTWSCNYTRGSAGYQARAVWNTAGATSVAYSGFVQYRDLNGGVHTIPSSGTIMANNAPILLENASTVMTPTNLTITVQ